MQYIVSWPNDKGSVFDSRFATWNGHVSDVTLGLRWAIGKSFENARDHIISQGGMIELVEGSHDKSTLTDIKFGDLPAYRQVNPEAVVITRGRDGSQDD
jgi:hypothetical protein